MSLALESLRVSRARIWGSAGMPRALMADKDCWLQLMSLDPVTGLDPEGTRLRAHEGLDGVDFFVPVRTQCRTGSAPRGNRAKVACVLMGGVGALFQLIIRVQE